MSARLVGVRAKIERAKHHINDLDNRIISFRGTNPYTLRCDYDSQTGNRVFRTVVCAAIPDEFAVIAGEAVHQLRSALDHLAWQLVETNGGTPDRDTCFPLDRKPPSNEATFARKVQGMSVAAANLIRSKQPYQPGCEVLGALHEVDNFDKHRLLLVAAYGVQQFGFSYRNPILDRDPTFREIVERFRATVPAPVVSPGLMFLVPHDGDQVASIAWPDGPEPQVGEELHLTYEMVFAQPEVVECQPVLPVLRQFCQAVEDAVHDFESLL
ncbi:MAG: hypothetical protein U0744_04375 [Gemmataceae bacterium]